MTTLTISEIAVLARFAGLTVDDGGMSEDELMTEMTIEDCPPKGITGDTGEAQKYTGSIVYFTDLPEEGVMPLGEPIGKPVGCSENPASCERNEGCGCECELSGRAPD